MGIVRSWEFHGRSCSLSYVPSVNSPHPPSKKFLFNLTYPGARIRALAHVDTNTASRPLISPYISEISRPSIRASSLPRRLSFLLPSAAGLFPERSFQTRFFCAVFGCFLVRERRTAVKSVCEADEELSPQNSSPQPLYPRPLARGLNGTRFLDACARPSRLAHAPERRRAMLLYPGRPRGRPGRSI